jgi:hypothetical protein
LIWERYLGYVVVGYACVRISGIQKARKMQRRRNTKKVKMRPIVAQSVLLQPRPRPSGLGWEGVAILQGPKQTDPDPRRRNRQRGLPIGGYSGKSSGGGWTELTEGPCSSFGFAFGSNALARRRFLDPHLLCHRHRAVQCRGTATTTTTARTKQPTSRGEQRAALSNISPAHSFH